MAYKACNFAVFKSWTGLNAILGVSLGKRYRVEEFGATCRIFFYNLVCYCTRDAFFGLVPRAETRAPKPTYFYIYGQNDFSHPDPHPVLA